MISRDNDLDPNFRSPSVLAAEYILGLLPAAEMLALEERRKSDPAFEAEVLYWQGRFYSLAEEAPLRQPSERVWENIAERVRASGSSSKSRSRSSLWNNLGFWRGIAAVSMAAAATLAVVLGFTLRQGPLPDASDLVAVITLDPGPVAFVVSYDRDKHEVLVVPASTWSKPDRVPELWIVPSGQRPISLGVLDASRPLQLVIPSQYAPHARAGAVLVITLEPKGGAPGGVATGPVVARGTLESL